jgi:hypothetical protein
MTRHGFDPLPSEWWHYDHRGWERFELMNVPLEVIPSRGDGEESGRRNRASTQIPRALRRSE